MKLNWTAIQIVLSILLPVIVWGVTVETRLATTAKVETLNERIEQLEAALLPVLIEYKVAETLKTRLQSVAQPPIPMPVRGGRPTKGFTVEVDEDKARGMAEQWARSQLPNVSQTEK